MAGPAHMETAKGNHNIVKTLFRGSVCAHLANTQQIKSMEGRHPVFKITTTCYHIFDFQHITLKRHIESQESKT